ncbi:hypothetical protein LTR08_006493 [Meristemomyces frigidus]|nr:hypothetical protein LTR08_006493 [Meristemomyces frigidus]
MTSQKKATASGSGWGSLLSGAVANLESRLDTILAEEPDATTRPRAGDAGARLQRTDSGSLAPPLARASAQGSREVSRTRGEGRLAERLAKATAAKSSAPSRVGSPVNANAGGSGRTIAEVRGLGGDVGVVLDGGDAAGGTAEASVREEAAVNGEAYGKTVPAASSTLLRSGLPINPARVSVDSPRPSLEATKDEDSSQPSPEQPNGHTSPSSPTNPEAQLEQLRQDYAYAEHQRQEEMHAYLEKIDALQAKLQYLAKETVAAAKEANAATSSSGSEAARLAEKDERIALLMQEGEKLSKTELRHLQTIKKLRAKTAEEGKAASEVRVKLERAEKAEAELKLKLRRAEAAERQASAQAKQMAGLEVEVEALRVEREGASELVRRLSGQLSEARERADRAETEASSKASEVDRGKVAALERELEAARAETERATERLGAETRGLRDSLAAGEILLAAREAEGRVEMAALEARLEAALCRAEEARVEGVSAAHGVALLRQVEGLQRQYALARGNWETIENSLNARLYSLELERDEAVRREGEVRRKAREAGVRARALEAAGEAAREAAGGWERAVEGGVLEAARLRAEVEALRGGEREARAGLERAREVWDAELPRRIEEARLAWVRAEASSSQVALASLSSGDDGASSSVAGVASEGARGEAASSSGRVAALERELAALARRYEASLELLGEREEECEELRQDVGEVKAMYRVLVEEKVGPVRGGDVT